MPRRHTLRLLAASTLLCLAALTASAQERSRQVIWNNPDRPPIPGTEHHSFRSPSMDVEVGYNVYVPPGYAESRARYPVIWFLHGAGGNENSDAGAFSGLVSKMAVERQIPPAICVFPNGGLSGYQDRPEQKVMGETMIVRELLPIIDRDYRTRKDRGGRVLAGFSMGGGGAVRLALKYPELFSAAGAWAAAVNFRSAAPSPELSTDNLRQVDGRVRLLLVVGDKDLTYPGHLPFFRSLAEARYPYRAVILPGIDHNLGTYYERTAEELARFLTAEFTARARQ
jgi:S-formylglutathione hydrolase FrmB